MLIVSLHKTLKVFWHHFFWFIICTCCSLLRRNRYFSFVGGAFNGYFTFCVKYVFVASLYVVFGLLRPIVYSVYLLLLFLHGLFSFSCFIFLLSLSYFLFLFADVYFETPSFFCRSSSFLHLFSLSPPFVSFVPAF